MAQYTAFGKTVMHELIDRDKSQQWLIEEVKKKTGCFCDSSLMSHLLVGQRKASAIKAAICEILGIEEQDDENDRDAND